MQHENLVKIGITNRKVKDRATNISKSSNMPFVIKYSMYFENGAIPNNIENILLAELREQFKSPVTKFDGSTECFYGVDSTRLLTRISEIVTQLTAA